MTALESDEKETSQSPEKQTIAHIIMSMAAAFIITAALLLLYFSNLSRENQTKTIFLANDKKTIELNTFFNSAETIVQEFQAYILATIDEEKLLYDYSYEEEYMENLTKLMSSIAVF